MDVHFWCVPVRLVWEHWQAMNGEQPNPDDSTDYVTPQITTEAGVEVGSIYDYFNIPVGVTDLDFNAFNFRAYNLVWNEWYRDENLQDRVTEETGDTDEESNYTLLKRGKRKDYFTGCLPFPQKGEAVDLPLGTSAPVYGDGNALALRFYGNGTTSNIYTGAWLGQASSSYLQHTPVVSPSNLSDPILTSGGTGYYATNGYTT